MKLGYHSSLLGGGENEMIRKCTFKLPFGPIACATPLAPSGVNFHSIRESPVTLASNFISPSPSRNTMLAHDLARSRPVTSTISSLRHIPIPRPRANVNHSSMCLSMYSPNSSLANISSHWAETGRDRIAPCPVEHEKVYSSGLREISDRKSG